MIAALPGREKLWQALSGAAVFLAISALLFFRNTQIFLAPEPWAEDMAVFLRDEYERGFPDTAFALYAGYIHLLPRLIAWLSLKAGLGNAMFVMNWSVLLIKCVICLLILRSREIPSSLMRLAIAGYLILIPFVNEIYNNVTNLQWWLIPLMALLILRRDGSLWALLTDAVILLLTGLTGVNSVIFAIPCAYLLIKDRTMGSVVRNSVVIICALVQFYFLCASGRSGDGSLVFEGGLSDLICIFVGRVVFHTLFKSDVSLVVGIPVLALFAGMLALNLRRYGNLREVRFITLFAAVYAAVILYNLLKSERDPEVLLTGFSGERYFVFLRICAFALLISTLDIILKTPRLQGNRGKIMAVIFLLLAVVLVRRYPVSFPSGSGYSADIERFEAVKPGEGVTIHFPPDWNCALVKK